MQLQQCLNGMIHICHRLEPPYQYSQHGSHLPIYIFIIFCCTSDTYCLRVCSRQTSHVTTNCITKHQLNRFKSKYEISSWLLMFNYHGNGILIGRLEIQQDQKTFRNKLEIHFFIRIIFPKCFLFFKNISRLPFLCSREYGYFLLVYTGCSTISDALLPEI